MRRRRALLRRTIRSTRRPDTALAVELGDGDVKVVRRTNSQPVRSIKGQRPRTAAIGS